MLELFGEPERWSSTLRNLLWTHASVTVPSFEESCLVDVPVPCTYDFNVAAAKYFYGLEDGESYPCSCCSAEAFFIAEKAAICKSVRSRGARRRVSSFPSGSGRT